VEQHTARFACEAPPTIYGQNKKQFTRLLKNLQQDLDPVGTPEELLVERIAQAYWRLGVAAWHRAEAFTRENPFQRSSISPITRYKVNDQPPALPSHEPTGAPAAAAQRGQRAGAVEFAGAG